MRKVTAFELVGYWLLLTAASFAVGTPFVVFLHFFGGDWFELLSLSTVLSSYFTLLVWFTTKKQMRP